MDAGGRIDLGHIHDSLLERSGPGGAGPATNQGQPRDGIPGSGSFSMGGLVNGGREKSEDYGLSDVLP